MGYDQRRIEVVVDVSCHNDERDKRDEALFEKLRAEIRALLDKPEYEPLRSYVS